ncbi:MAG: type II secretion system protein [Alphaproteobacteria bacterium]|jgi:prepilin-type N-terminal cleavage/methylation domain-containing protein
MKKSSGFSLAEMAIVLVIIGLIAGAGLSITNFLRAYKVDVVVSEVGAINLAVQNFNRKYRCKGDSSLKRFFVVGLVRPICDCSNTGISCLPCYDNGACPTTGCLDNSNTANYDNIRTFACFDNTKNTLQPNPIPPAIVPESNRILVNIGRNTVNVAIPGDFARASTFISGATNGNGNAIINDDSNASIPDERNSAIQQLSLTQMIDLAYVANANFTVGQNAIPANLSKGSVGYIFGGDEASMPAKGNNPNFLILGANSSSSSTLGNGALNQNEAFKVESKMDDGNFATGRVLGRNVDPIGSNPTCAAAGDRRACRLQFWLDNFDINETIDNKNIRGIGNNGIF